MRTSALARVVSKTECCGHTAPSPVGRQQDSSGGVGGGEKSDMDGSVNRALERGGALLISTTQIASMGICSR